MTEKGTDWRLPNICSEDVRGQAKHLSWLKEQQLPYKVYMYVYMYIYLGNLQ
jgi:hypothetical protein